MGGKRGRETVEEMRGKEKQKIEGEDSVRERETHYVGISENK